MAGKVKATLSKCSGCGDDMIFNPDSDCLFCVSCKSQKQIKSQLGLPKHDIKEQDILSSHKNSEWLNHSKSMHCPNCGAQVLLQQFQTSANCPYCNTDLIADKEEFSGLKPDAIIPFKFGKEKAEELFKSTLKNKMFINSDFKRSITANDIQSYYFPAFLFDASCSTVFSGELYGTYTVEDKDGNSHTKKRYFHIGGNKNTFHSNIEIEASTKLSQYELNMIKPYNFVQSKIYTNEYVFGYSMECYSSSLKDSDLQAESIIKREIKNSILSDYRYDGVSSFSMQTNFLNKNFSYCLLPVYRFNYTHKNKNYSNVMNGQTGKLGGSYPKSGWKIALISILASSMFLLPPIIIFILAVT